MRNDALGIKLPIINAGNNVWYVVQKESKNWQMFLDILICQTKRTNYKHQENNV